MRGAQGVPELGWLPACGPSPSFQVKKNEPQAWLEIYGMRLRPILGRISGVPCPVPKAGRDFLQKGLQKAETLAACFGESSDRFPRGPGKNSCSNKNLRLEKRSKPKTALYLSLATLSWEEFRLPAFARRHFETANAACVCLSSPAEWLPRCAPPQRKKHAAKNRKTTFEDFRGKMTSSGESKQNLIFQPAHRQVGRSRGRGARKSNGLCT